MDIFQQYCHAFDEIIDAKLKESIDQDKVDAFYSDFKSKQMLYKTQNEGVYTTLFTLVDFDSFKKDILSAKKTIANDSNATTDSVQTDMHSITEQEFW